MGGKNTQTSLNTGWLRNHYESARVSLAANGKLSMLSGQRLDPYLWEALRVEMQRRWREATGEEHAILTVNGATDG